MLLYMEFNEQYWSVDYETAVYTRLQCKHMYLKFCMDRLETLDHLEAVKLCSEQVSKPAGALEQLQQMKREHHPMTQGTVQLTVVEETTRKRHHKQHSSLRHGLVKCFAHLHDLVNGVMSE